MDVIGTDFENWGPYLMKQFQLMYEKGERCDLEISCNKQIFLVHRLIMSACSEYVRELGDKQHIILPDEVSCKALKSVIDFVYSGKIVFNKNDKDDLLLASNLLNMRLLTELIKMEESCSFTLSMDDEVEESKTADSTNNTLDAENEENNSVNINDQSPFLVSNQNPKKKSNEIKTNRPRSSKDASLLPHLFKLPYLQQKFSASRTYGLITTLTDPVPSRFEIPDSILHSCGYRSTFENVTYETEILCSDENFVTLEPSHHEFLKKLRDSSSHKRSYSNSLYSPFDKYTPPYNLNSDLSAVRKRETVRESALSYLSTSETISPKIPKKNEHCKTTFTPKKSVTFAKETEIISEKINNSLQSIDNQNNSYVLNGAELELPDPLNPVANILEEIPSEIVEVPSVENGEKVELIKLNNAVIRNVNKEFNSRAVQEELPDISISVVASENQNTTLNVKEEIPCEEENSVPNSSLLNTSQVAHEMNISPLNNSAVISKTSCTSPEKLDQLAESTPSNSLENEIISTDSMDIDVGQISSNITTDMSNSLGNTASNSNKDILSDSPVLIPTDNKSITDSQISTNPVQEVDTNKTDSNVTKNSSNNTPDTTSDSIKSILSDSTVFTPINNKNITDLSPNVNSQIFALRVKGTENPDQLSKLVDLCKKNPLFKDKNVKFKIVPVKGPIQNTLKDQTRLSGNMLNKAIIVKKKIENPKVESKKIISETVTKKKEKTPSIENVIGPWDCRICGEPDKPSKFNSYFDYRSHLHDIHKEANNPIYCMYCGHKALKRNMQLYHLFTKHNVKPPAHVNFPKCDKCQFFALNDYYLQKHIASHESSKMEYVCSCKAAFKSSDLLQKHMVSNDCKNLKSFTCGYCRSIFDRFVNLKAHMRMCMKEKSKPILQNLEINSEPSPKTVCDEGKDYVSL